MRNPLLWSVEKFSLRIYGQCGYNECIGKRRDIFIKIGVIKE